MKRNQKKQLGIKMVLHPANKHRLRYNLDALVHVCPELKPFVIKNKFGDDSIEFFDPLAVKMLNKALLIQDYNMVEWDIPKGYLCPPIPGRADYIHNIADLLYGRAGFAASHSLENKDEVIGLDIGVGANAIYPIIGISEYPWKFIGTDIDLGAIENVNYLIASNAVLQDKLQVKLQPQRESFFENILDANQKIDFTMCNPPFHASAEAAEKATTRKLKNLTKEKVSEITRNFGGGNNELWCFGGEEKFVSDMIVESEKYASQVLWFTTLISKQPNLKVMYNVLKKVGAIEVRTLSMGQGNKVSRVLAWSFQTPNQHRDWVANK